MSPLFRDNLIWKKAQKGHLIAFAGLFLFHEEHQKSVNNLNNQYQVYENVCKNIQVSVIHDKNGLYEHQLYLYVIFSCVGDLFFY